MLSDTLQTLPTCSKCCSEATATFSATLRHVPACGHLWIKHPPTWVHLEKNNRSLRRTKTKPSVVPYCTYEQNTTLPEVANSWWSYFKPKPVNAHHVLVHVCTYACTMGVSMSTGDNSSALSRPAELSFQRPRTQWIQHLCCRVINREQKAPLGAPPIKRLSLLLTFKGTYRYWQKDAARLIDCRFTSCNGPTRSVMTTHRMHWYANIKVP